MLTDTKIKQSKPADKAYRLYDMNGLYLVVNPTGTKVWRYKFRLDKKEYTYTIGKYPAVGLQQARQQAQEAKLKVAQGINPTHDRTAQLAQNIAANEHTFKTVAQEWINEKRTTATPAYIKGIERDFKNYVYPIIGNLPISSITPQQVMACLEKCRRKNIVVTGINIRARISAVFRVAIRTMRAEHNPADAFIDYFSRPPIVHAQAMSKQELTELVRGLKQYNCTRIVVTALWLLLYTALRTIEIRRAEWQQFDFERELWVISADKMKRRRTHTIPLSRQVQTLLHELHHLSGNGRLLFPNSKRPDDLISATTINRALEYIGARITGHDFRATAATHLIEMGYPKE